MSQENRYKVLIADDEPGAIDLIAALLEPFAEYEIVATTQEPEEAKRLLLMGHIDVAFLDIEFPEVTVFDLLKDYPKHIRLVFVSAHSHYAIKAIKHEAVDYLLKPVDPDDFDEVMRRLSNGAPPAPETKSIKETSISLLQQQRIALPTQHGYQYFPVKDICYLTAQGSYALLHDISGNNFLVSRNLTDFERILESKGFIRIHRSYLINSECINSFSRLDGGTVEMNDGTALGISRKYKESTLKRISELSEKI